MKRGGVEFLAVDNELIEEGQVVRRAGKLVDDDLCEMGHGHSWADVLGGVVKQVAILLGPSAQLAAPFMLVYFLHNPLFLLICNEVFNVVQAWC